ncbi:MAG: glycosyltransferase [Nitrosomonas sp.]|nr:glycosyltransferase [Nitrosomonas sp.]
MVSKVSIITVCHNSAETIGDTIESVLSQDYPCIEYIIIDGGSTDRTMDIIREYGDKIDIVISEPDKGIYDAMNKGIHAASGDVVGLLNSDDFYADETSVSQLIECMENADTDTVFADLVVVDAKNTDHVVRYYDSSNFHPRRLRYGWMPAHPTFMVRRDLYIRYGGFLLDYQIAADYEMVVRLFHTAGASYIYLPVVVIKMRAGGASTSGLKSSWVLNKEIIRACRTNGIETSFFRLLPKIPVKLMEYIRRPK